MSISYRVIIEVAVSDPKALYSAALGHAVRVDGMDLSDAEELLQPGGHIDIEACLVTIFDPGMSPAGTQIQTSYVD